MIFLGHVISSDGIIIESSKIDVVLQWEISKFVTEIQSFLSLVGYYRRLIEGFSKLALHLTKFSQKVQAYVWYVHCEEIFQELKGKLTSAPILILPSLSESFIVYSDASKTGLGGVLM